jgi:hypothetical protein
MLAVQSLITKAPAPGSWGQLRSINDTHAYTLAKEEETASELSVSLFLWLNCAEPVQTLGKSAADRGSSPFGKMLTKQSRR